jgi:hypothetical protein
VFEGFLPRKYNSIILDLLFDLAVWHAYAKLRLHTESTLTQMGTAVRILGFSLRDFAKTVCKAYVTFETARERAARLRRQTTAGKSLSGRKVRSFNLLTYKLHALGDYHLTIPQFGTAEGYSTQTVCFNLNIP